MYSFFKRVLDVLLSFFAILVFSPILFLIIIVLKFTGEGEVFYLQERVGYKSKIFKIYKFATMVKNSPNIGSGDVTLRNDPRVTKAGIFLRSSKLNELPQLLNILNGSISIIGPRPLMLAGYNRYSQKFKNSIYNVKPGLSGIGSIVFRDEEKILTDSKLPPHECYEKIILPYKGELEMWYQDNCSIYLDFILIFLTIWSVFFSNSKLYEKFLKNLPKRNF
jgi:lipopolysaccharide/colanic/teichoic acid biosynthesis glycosyltransferase